MTGLFNGLVEVKARLDAARNAYEGFARAEGPVERAAARTAKVRAAADLFVSLDGLDTLGGLAALIKMARDAEHTDRREA